MSLNTLTRRDALRLGGASALATAVSGTSSLAAETDSLSSVKTEYTLNYAPHVGLSSPADGSFAHHAGRNVIDQLRFMHELGFRAFEDNFMITRPVAEQRAIARELERLDMRLATFVAGFETTGPRGSILPKNGLTFAADDPDTRQALKAMIENAAKVAKRLNATWCTVLSGRSVVSLPWEYQTANVIENFKRLADLAAGAGLILGLEPINGREWTGTFVTTAPHGHLIVRGVNHPNVRMIYDTYHAQIETGGILENMDLAWDTIGYIQIADAPGRNEPGTGEMNYKRILQHLKDKGFDGFVGLEHGHSKPGKAGEVESLAALARVNPVEGGQ